jgi:signal recognition particle receptor subunit beta
MYEILNSDQYDENTPIVVVCNKQDLKFPNSRKIVESNLSNEIENIKQVKQKNNLEDAQIGTLFSMKTKFNFGMFKNVHFLESDKTSRFESLVTLINKLL